METFYLQFIDFPSNHKGEFGLNFGPRAYIGIKQCSIIKFPCKKGEKMEFTCISPECRTHREITEQLTMLRQELEIIEKEAKEYFRKNMYAD